MSSETARTSRIPPLACGDRPRGYLGFHLHRGYRGRICYLHRDRTLGHAARKTLRGSQVQPFRIRQHRLHRQRRWQGLPFGRRRRAPAVVSDDPGPGRVARGNRAPGLPQNGAW